MASTRERPALPDATSIPESTASGHAYPDPRVLDAFPTLRQAAKMIDVSAGALSRRRDVRAERRGRELRLPPATVLALARYYRKRSEYDVAADLVEYALANGGEFIDTVEAEIDAFFAGGEAQPMDPEAFLAEAKRSLPEPLYRQIEATYRQNLGARLGGAVTATPED